jgi:tRNA(adenine34) deaminase
MSGRAPEKLDFDERFMSQALVEAGKAFQSDEVPVGCVVVHDGQIVGRGYNRTESLNDPTAHAEILAITAAAGYMGSWRLAGCTLYCTLEPCVMCAGALVLARVERLVFGARDPKFGGCVSLYSIVTDGRLNHRLALATGVLEDDCARIMQEFFRNKRKQDNNGIQV